MAVARRVPIELAVSGFIATQVQTPMVSAPAGGTLLVVVGSELEPTE